MAENRLHLLFIDLVEYLSRHPARVPDKHASWPRRSFSIPFRYLNHGKMWLVNLYGQDS